MVGYQRLRSFWVLALSLALLVACGRGRELDRQLLKLNFVQSTGIELCYSGEVNSSMHVLAQRLKHEIEERAAYGGELRLVAPGEELDPACMRLCIGLAGDARLMQLLEPLGVEPLPGGGFSWRGLEHAQAGDALLACFPDPERPGMPMLVILGVEAASLARRSFELPAPWIPSISTWCAGAPGLRAQLEIDGSVRASSLRQTHHARGTLAFAEPRNLDSQLRLHAGTELDPNRLAAYLAACQAVAKKIEAGFGRPFKERVELYVYSHVEDMQAALGHSALSWLDTGSLSVHALLQPGLPDDAGAGVARAMALGLAGQPQEPWMLEAVGLGLSGKQWGRPLQSAWKQLAEAGRQPRPEEVLSGDLEGICAPRILKLARTWYIGLGNLEAQHPAPGALGELWSSTAETLAASARNSEPSGASGVQPKPSFHRRRFAAMKATWRGVALYDRPDIHGGGRYGSRAAGAALDAAKGAGANAFSLTLRVASDVPDAWLSGSRSTPWASASDVQIASLMAAGRQRSLNSMWVLDPLLGVGQDRLDQAQLNDVPSRREFLRQLEFLATHYAHLGELLGLDILCLGTSLEQGGATLLHADDGLKPEMQKRKKQLDRGWTEMIERLRRVYGGALTYGTHMGTPLYQVGFWKQLDFVGLLGFGPQLPEGFQAGGDGVSQAALELEVGRQLRKGLQFQERTGRPPLFIQLGFPARDGAWSGWAAGRGKPDPAAQERFYGALATGVNDFVGRGKPVNFFLWNWGINQGTGYGAAADFSVHARISDENLGQILRSR